MGRFLSFGADVIAQIHMNHNIQPFFHHELFHIYHERRFAYCESVWCLMWSEGLATYVADNLNPGASDSELLLAMPEPIRARVDANRDFATCSVRGNLDATDVQTVSALFCAGDARDPRLPPRYAYYVGYLLATELGQTRNLVQLASLSTAEARPLIEIALDRMASC